MKRASWLCMEKLKYSMPLSRLSAFTLIENILLFKNKLEYKIINRLGGITV